jgi:hypothetical protein
MKDQVCIYCLADYLRKQEFVQRMRTAQIRKRVNVLTYQVVNDVMCEVAQ